MTIILDVSFENNQQDSGNGQSEMNRKKVKHSACSSKANKMAKVKHKNEKKPKRSSTMSTNSISPGTTNSSLLTSIKDSLIDNKEKLNDLNDQILNNQQINQPNYHHEHTTATGRNSIRSGDFRHFNPSDLKSESIMSSDSDIRFTRKKLGDNQRCGCILIAGFLVLLLVAGLILYAGFIFLHSKPQPNRIFRGRIRVIEGDYFRMNLTDQNSKEFFEKSREYRERINLLISRSHLRKFYDGCEILALDGRISDERNKLSQDLIVHFLLNFDQKSDDLLASVDDLRKLFVAEFQTDVKSPNGAKYFKNLKIDLNDFHLKEIHFGKFDDIFVTSSASQLDSYGNVHDIRLSEEVNLFPSRTCEPMKLKFCNQIDGHNMTTFPNLLGHQSREEIEKDLILFREVVDSECFLQSYDFLCHLLQPPCELSLDTQINEIGVKPRFLCRDYCELFAAGCLSRLPSSWKPYFDCERFPEQTSIQSCRHQPDCLTNLKKNQGLRVCDGVADCPNLEDELSCSYCPGNSIFCGRGRSCVSRDMRCDGKFDCPDGSDEKDCLSISPLVQSLVQPKALIPHRVKFSHEGFAVFSEKGQTGKLCAEGMETNEFVRATVAESLCKSLGYERVMLSEIRNDTENQNNYVRILDYRAAEISFVRTGCASKSAFWLACSHLECGRQSVVVSDNSGMNLPKLALPGDWPWLVALFKKENHVCDGTLVASHWVLTTASCFQGQKKEKWTAVFGNIRISSGITSPWSQKRRIIGMVKSPVEGSTVALVRLQTPVVYSDFVRPVCLSDDDFAQNSILTDYAITSPLSSADLVQQPRAEKFFGSVQKKKTFKEDRQFFKLSDNEKHEDDKEETDTIFHEVIASELVDEHMNSIRPEAQFQPQAINYYSEQNLRNENHEQQYLQCNTLGWSRQKEHLQRVQLNVIDMKACENISIATVNSLCAEATFHKQNDCTEEEFAGSPLLCQLSDKKRWALVGVSSWRIACTHFGSERPRMYDKITSNVAWIREIINSIIS